MDHHRSPAESKASAKEDYGETSKPKRRRIMNRRKQTLLFIAILEAMFFVFFTMLYLHGVIKFVTFASVIIIFSLIVNILLVIAIRKLPNS
jgi:hypothetical protein